MEHKGHLVVTLFIRFYYNLFMKLIIISILFVLITTKAFSNGWQINDRGNRGADAIVNLYVPQLKRWSHLVVEMTVRQRCNVILGVSLKTQKTLGQYSGMFQEKVVLAGQAISETAVQKIKDGDVILVYAW